MGARPYDPSIGRFLAVDPVDGGSLNNYDYAGQDPQNKFDLAGTVEQAETDSGTPDILAVLESCDPNATPALFGASGGSSSGSGWLDEAVTFAGRHKGQIAIGAAIVIVGLAAPELTPELGAAAGRLLTATAGARAAGAAYVAAAALSGAKYMGVQRVIANFADGWSKVETRPGLAHRAHSLSSLALAWE